MSFLHLYLLGGLTLIAAPVLIHLVTREKPKHLRFPAFRFLRQKYQSNRRKLRLHHLLLLLLRMLLIVLLCLALARPRLYSGLPSFLGGVQPVNAVLLFDTSSSMEYERGGITRLEDAKRRALELLEELPQGSRVAILDSAERGGEFLDRPAQIRERIQALEVRPANGPVTRQLERAYTLLAEIEKESEGAAEPPPRYLFVFSDRTRPCWDGADVKNLKLAEGDVSAAFVDVGVKEPEDLAVERVIVEPPSVPPGGTVRIQVFIRATGKRADRKVVCHLDDDRVRPQEKVVQVEAGAVQSVVFQYRAAPFPKSESRNPKSETNTNKPGSDFGFPSSDFDLKMGHHWAVVRLEGTDRLPFNNVRFATFVVRPGRKVLTLMDQPSAREPWTIALEVLGFSSTIAAIENAENVNLKGYDLVCLYEAANPGNALWRKLAAYVNDGGKLAVVPPGGNEATAYNTEVARELLPGELAEIGQAASDRGRPWRFDAANTAPLMAPFLRWKRESNDIEFLRKQGEPLVYRFWKVKPAARARVISQYDDPDRSPALLERDLGRGKVLLFTTRLDTRREQVFPKPHGELPWQNYWFNSFGLVLVDKSCRYLAGDSVALDWNFVCGETIALPLTTEGPEVSYVLTGPGQPPQGLPLSVPPARGAATPPTRKAERVLSISRALQPGNYAVYATRNGIRETFERFSLNVHPRENILTPQVPKEEVEAVLGPESLLPVDHNLKLHDVLASKRQPVELFPWLMLALLLFLAVETLVGNRRREARAEDKETGRQGDKETISSSWSPGLLVSLSPCLLWAALGAVGGGVLGMLRGGYGAVAAGAVLTALFGMAHGLVVVARFPPRDGAILGSLLGSIVGVLYGWLILAPPGWFGGLFEVLGGLLLGGGLMALDGWFIGSKKSGASGQFEEISGQ